MRPAVEQVSASGARPSARFTHEIDQAARRMRTRVTGPVSYRDITEHLDAEVRDEGEGCAELIDATMATAAFSSEDVRSVVARLRGLAATRALGPTAVVVGDDVSYGMIRMLAMLVEDACQVEVFRSVADAEGWLDW